MSGTPSNVIHVTSWLSRQGGGIPPVIWNLARHTCHSGLDCSVAGLQDQWTEEDCSPYQIPFVSGSLKGPRAFGFARGLSAQVATLVNNNSVIHTHGLWMYASLLSRQCARRVSCPRLVSPHGMLEPWALQNSPWKKRAAAWLFENKNLRSADCLHALCPAEAKNFRRYGLRNPIAIIPNGVDLSELSRPSLGTSAPSPIADVEPGQKILLFLSRLHSKKGLENLLQAWRDLASTFLNWKLVIAGSGLPQYEQCLQRLVSIFGLQTRVVFCGPVHGTGKVQLLRSASGFVLPSFSEGFSMAVLEAAAAGLPVVLTRECNFPELAAAAAAYEISPDSSSVEMGLRRLLNLSDEERRQMGDRGRNLIQQSYMWPAIASRMMTVYRWMAGAGPQPEYVHLD